MQNKYIIIINWQIQQQSYIQRLMVSHMRDANSVVGTDDLPHVSRKAVLKEVFQEDGMARVL